ncbi:MAG: ABC transporter permease subunit [Dehalogenimonas sp.]
MNVRLFLANLKLSRGGIFAWGFLIFLYALLTMYLYPTVADSSGVLISYLASMPKAMLAAFGLENIDPSTFIITPESFASLEFLVLWPVMLGVYAIFSGISIAKEAERGTLDILLAQPVSRAKVMSSKFTVFILGLIIVALLSILGLMVGAALVNEIIDTTALLLVLIEAAMLSLAIGGYTLLFNAIFLEPRKAMLVSGILTGGAYILNFMVPVLSEQWQWLRNLSLFYHFKPNEIIKSASFDNPGFLIFTLTALISIILAFAVFRRRDLSV